MAKVFLVEDDPEIRGLMALHLQRQGFQIQEFSDAESAVEAVAKESCDLLVMDWMLPGMSGVSAIEHLRQKGESTGVLMVTARANDADIVKGLESGADDYLAKPFELNVFLARVKALVRRQKIMGQKQRTLELAGLHIDLDNYEVSLLGEKISLTPSELKLLICLIQGRGKVLTRDQLIQNIQGDGVNVTGRTVDTHIFGLRRKLGGWGENVETIRGIGYRVKVE